MNERKENKLNTNDANESGPLTFADIPTLAEERWRIVDEGDRWTVWFIPLNHPEQCRELATFSTEAEAVNYMKSI
jgi:hypothetical protein